MQLCRRLYRVDQPCPQFAIRSFEVNLQCPCDILIQQCRRQTHSEVLEDENSLHRQFLGIASSYLESHSWKFEQCKRLQLAGTWMISRRRIELPCPGSGLA